MKRTLKAIGTIGTLIILLLTAYLLGTTKAETITEVKEVEKIVEVVADGYIDMRTEEFYNNYIDMRQVVDFETSENGLYLYLEDGNGYYWERQIIE